MSGLISVTLNAGTMLALHMVELALRKHLKADQIIWSHMEISENPARDGWRHFTIGHGLVHVPGTATILHCVANVALVKDGNGWAMKHLSILCSTSDDSSGTELPLGIEAVTHYYCEGLGWNVSPGDVLLPSRHTRFPLAA